MREFHRNYGCESISILNIGTSTIFADYRLICQDAWDMSEGHLEKYPSQVMKGESIPPGMSDIPPHELVTTRKIAFLVEDALVPLSFILYLQASLSGNFWQFFSWHFVLAGPSISGVF